jgi:hypothetical protein
MTKARIIREIKGLAPSARVADTLKFWRVGEQLQQLRTLGVDDPVAVVSRSTGICAREVRYCAKVREAFKYARLEPLVRQGLRWSTVRILASDCLAPHRDQLITDFESGRLSNAELLGEVMALNGRGREAKEKRGDGGGRERRLQRLAATVVSQSARLVKTW